MVSSLAGDPPLGIEWVWLPGLADFSETGGRGEGGVSLGQGGGHWGETLAAHWLEALGAVHRRPHSSFFRDGWLWGRAVTSPPWLPQTRLDLKESQLMGWAQGRAWGLGPGAPGSRK